MGSGSSVPKITPHDRAILDLKLQRDKIRQYQRKIEGVLQREHEIAKIHLANGNKQRALIALRQRKYQEGLLSKTDAQLETLENLVSTVEFSLVEVSVLHGLKQGNQVLKDLHREMNMESVEKLLDETHEAQAYQREIDEMLANNLTLDDEQAVQDELQSLINSENQKETDSAALPSVPNTAPESVSDSQKDDAIAEGRGKIAVPA